MSSVSIIKKLEKRKALTQEEFDEFLNKTTKISEDKANRIREVFENNPVWDMVWIFWDGHIEEDSVFKQKNTSRAAQLLGIIKDGFPLSISRRHPQIAGEKLLKDGYA